MSFRPQEKSLCVTNTHTYTQVLSSTRKYHRHRLQRSIVKLYHMHTYTQAVHEGKNYIRTYTHIGCVNKELSHMHTGCRSIVKKERTTTHTRTQAAEVSSTIIHTHRLQKYHQSMSHTHAHRLQRYCQEGIITHTSCRCIVNKELCKFYLL